MTEFTVLALAGNAAWLQRLWAGLRDLAGSRLIVAATLDEAREILECVEPRLVVVNGDPEVLPDERIDELLWANSTLHHPATLVVAADAYDPDRAVSLFQMGVDEYLGGDHWNRISEILGRLLSLSPNRPSTAVILPVSEPIEPVSKLRTAPLRWVTAEPA